MNVMDACLWPIQLIFFSRFDLSDYVNLSSKMSMTNKKHTDATTALDVGRTVNADMTRETTACNAATANTAATLRFIVGKTQRTNPKKMS